MKPMSKKVENFAMEICDRMTNELTPGEAGQVAAMVAAYIASHAKDDTPEGRCRVVDKIEGLAKVFASIEPPKKRDRHLDTADMLKDLDPFKMHS